MPSMLYKCFKCNKDMSSNEVRYIGKAEKTNIICTVCLEKYKLAKKGMTAEDDDFMQEKQPIKQEEKTVPKTQYMCQSCNYSFYIRKDSQQRLICPYCGKDNLIIKQHTA